MGYEQQVFFNRRCVVCPSLSLQMNYCAVFIKFSLFIKSILNMFSGFSLFTCPSLEEIQDKVRVFLFNLKV